MLQQENIDIIDQEMILWIHENQDIFHEFRDELIIESIKIEQFDRMYGFLLEDVCPNYRRENILHEDLRSLSQNVINESWASLAADVGIGLGSMIPGIGQAIAGGGVFYYLYRAYDNFSKGRNFEYFMDLMSAGFTAPQAIPALGTAVGAAGKAVVKVIQKIFGPIFNLFGKIRGSISSFFKAGKASVKGSKFITDITTKLSAKSAEIGKLSPVVKTVSKYLNKLRDFIKSGATRLDPVFKRLGFSVDDGIKTIDDGAAVVDDFAKLTEKAASGATDDVVDITMDLGAKLDVFSPADASRLKNLRKVKSGLSQSKRSAGLAKSTLGKAETIAYRGSSALDDLSKLGKSSDEIFDIMTVSRKTAVETFERLTGQVKGLQKEFLRVRGYPKGTKMLPQPGGFKIIKPDGKITRISIEQGGKGAKTYSNFLEFMKNSKSYKNYQQSLSKSLTKVNAEIAELIAKKKGAEAASKIAIEKATKKALTDPKVAPEVLKGFLDGLSDKAFKKIGQAVLGSMSTLTSTLETASTEQMDARRSELEDGGADFGSSDYTLGAF